MGLRVSKHGKKIKNKEDTEKFLNIDVKSLQKRQKVFTLSHDTLKRCIIARTSKVIKMQ